MNTRNEMDGLPAAPLRRRLLPAFLAASFAVHAAVAVVVTPPALDYEPAKVRVLEVVLVQSMPPRPLPVEPENIRQQQPRSRATEREPARQAAAPEPRRVDAQPVLTLPEPGVVAEPVISVPRPAGKRASPSEARTDVASAAATLPSFSAAYLRNPAPRYPVAARRAGEQGTVTLRVLVTRDGRPARVDIEKTSGSAHLDAAALEAVKDWQFVPARQGQDTIESWVLVPIVFRLEGVS